MDPIARNVTATRERMAAACARSGRPADAVRLVAVTKTVGPAVLPRLRAAGVRDFGENRVGHLEAMAGGVAAGDRFHFIGRVQSRQFKRIVPLCSHLHSLHRVEHVAKLAATCRREGASLEVFCQVNTGQDPAKAGLRGDEMTAALDAIAGATDVLTPVGLMVMAPFVDDEHEIRSCFADCRSLAERHGLPRLSMGMSADFEFAIEEGATDVRLGSILLEGYEG